MIFLLAVAGLLIASLLTACFDYYIWTGLTYLAALVLGYYTVDGFNAIVNSYGLWNIATVALPIYLLIGFAVSAGKWTLYMREFGACLAEQLKRFNAPEYKTGRDFQLDAMDERQRSLVTRFQFLRSDDEIKAYHPSIRDIDYYKIEDRDQFNDAITPSPKDHLDRFTFWVLEWPFVLFALIFKNFVLELVLNFVNLFGGVFKRIGKYFVGNATANIKL